MKTNKRFLALCLALLLVCAVLPAPTAQGADVQPVLSAALAHQAAAVPSPGYGDEWTVLGLARGGYFAVDSDYFARYYADVASKAPELTAASGKAGALNAYKSTDNSRVILALSAIGRDATQVGGCDLTAPYTDFAWVRNQGINGPVFALLALDSRNYLSGSAVRRQCVDEILAAELSGGGWAMNGAAADPDVTAMVLQALGYEHINASCVCGAEQVNPKVQSTVDADALSKMTDRWAKYNMDVCGPVALDLAVSVEACHHKHYNAPGAGKADILLVPNYEVGNGIGKAANLFGNAKNAGIILGAKVPIVLVSRADSAYSKLASIALGSVLSSRMKLA